MKGDVKLANVAKFSLKEIGHVCAHFERTVKPGHYSNLDIDSSKTIHNENLAPHRPEGQVKYVKKMLDNISHAKRKDLVCLCSIVVNVPKDLPAQMHEKFFRETYKFLCERYGTISGFKNKEDIVVSCYRHCDETTDHIHFAFTPIKIDQNGKQRFIAKEVICREDLKTLHSDLEKYLSEHGCRCQILNGNTQKDEFGKALSVRALKRRDAHKIERQIERRF